MSSLNFNINLKASGQNGHCLPHWRFHRLSASSTSSLPYRRRIKTIVSRSAETDAALITASFLGLYFSLRPPSLRLFQTPPVSISLASTMALILLTSPLLAVCMSTSIEAVTPETASFHISLPALLNQHSPKTPSTISELSSLSTLSSHPMLPRPARYSLLSNYDYQYDESGSFISDSEHNQEDHASGTDLCDQKGGIMALGMETGQIPDSALSASSAFEMLHVGPQNARLRVDKAGGAWCPSKQLGFETSGSEWIQVDFDQLHVITGVATQGRYGKSLGQEFTEWYNVLYSREIVPSKWIKWKNLDGRSNLEGNIDPNTVEEHQFDLPIVAIRHIRIVPLSNHTRTVCLRFELFGCQYQGPISYTIPAVSNFVQKQDQPQMVDNTYDGSVSDSGIQFGGLGQLVDGIRPIDAKIDKIGQLSRDYLWVGWPQLNASESSLVKLVFEFDQAYNFTAISINCLNSYSHQIRAFSVALVWFSLDNEHWSSTPIRFEYQPDNVIELPRDINIYLKYRIGRFVRIELIYNSSRLQISEISFDCRPLAVNLTEKQLAHLFERSNSLNYNPATEDVITGGGTRYIMPEDNQYHIANGSMVNDGKAAEFYPVQHDTYGKTIKYSLIIVCLCTIGLVIISLLTSVAFRKLNNRKNNIFREISDTDLESENATINLKNLPKESSPLYCDPKEISPLQEEADYAVPDVICPVNLSKTLSFHKTGPTPITTKTLQINPRFYASSDIICPKQNIYGTRPGPQILNVFDIANLRTLNQHHSRYPHPNSYHQQKLNQQQQQQQSPLLDTFGGGGGVGGGGVKAQGTLYHNSARSSIYGDAISSTFGVRIYSEAEIGVIQSLGKSGKFGDVLLCNVPAAGKNRLAVVRTVNDLNLKNDFVQSMDYMRKLSQNCDKFARLFGVIETPIYFASITEYADCDLNYFLRKSSPDQLSFDSLVYIAREIASACAYLELANQTHRDIASRNVIVYEKSLAVKLTDSAIFMDKYSIDYCNGLPIRWMSPEAIVRTEFTVLSDVYAFGVFFWEILTYCECRPFTELSDEDFLNAIYAHVDQQEEMIRLPRPSHCSAEIYELLEECWNSNENQRPTFKEICLFLQRKTLCFQKPSR